MIDLSVYDFTADPLKTRLANLAAAGRRALPGAEYIRRTAWCRQHDSHLRFELDGDDLVLVWGNAPLVTLDEGLLRQLRDDDEGDVDMTLAPDLPDDPSTLDGEGL